MNLLGAAVVVRVAVAVLRDQRAVVGDVDESVAIVVGIGTAVDVLEVVAVFRIVGTLIDIVLDPVAVAVAHRGLEDPRAEDARVGGREPLAEGAGPGADVEVAAALEEDLQ